MTIVCHVRGCRWVAIHLVKKQQDVACRKELAGICRRADTSHGPPWISPGRMLALPLPLPLSLSLSVCLSLSQTHTLPLSVSLSAPVSSLPPPHPVGFFPHSPCVVHAYALYFVRLYIGGPDSLVGPSGAQCSLRDWFCSFEVCDYMYMHACMWYLFITRRSRLS